MTAAAIAIIDSSTGEEIGICYGPASNGSCPRAEAGAAVPCAGQAIIPAVSQGAQPFAVPTGETGCPVTMAAVLLVAPDTVPEWDSPLLA